MAINDLRTVCDDAFLGKNQWVGGRLLTARSGHQLNLPKSGRSATRPKKPEIAL
jgi:hypothetical protein